MKLEGYISSIIIVSPFICGAYIVIKLIIDLIDKC